MAEKDTRQGLGTALETALRDAPARPPGAEQLALIPPEPGPAPAPAERGPGRPPGSRNRRTEEWTEYLLAKYPLSPLEVLMQLATASTEDLVKNEGVKRDEAAKLRKDCAVAAAPYLHQKQPVAVNVESKGMVYLTFEVPGEDELGGEEGGEGFDLTARVVGLEDAEKSEA